VTHILRPGKASEKTPKGVIPPSLCEISQNASRKKKRQDKNKIDVSRAIEMILKSIFALQHVPRCILPV
jgi:hypothetical protein